MCLFKKKKRTNDLIKEDKELVNYNSDRINVLLTLSKNEEFNEKLKKLQDDLHYLTPSQLPKVLEFDKKIKTQIDEMKVVLTKDSSADAKAENVLEQIKVLVAERNSNLK